MAKERTFRLTLLLELGDRVKMREWPYWTGTVRGIEAHFTHGDPLLLYRIQTDTPKRVSRYAKQEDLKLLVCVGREHDA